MSGTVTIGGTITGTPTTGPFQPYVVLAASALNAALIFGDKKGGNLDNCPIGQTTPAAGSFTTLTAVTPSIGDNSVNVATTAFVANAVGLGGGGGGVNVNSPSFTGVPTAPTAASGNSTTQIATTAFVANALSNTAVGSTYTGSGSNPGLFHDDGTGIPTTITNFFWPPLNLVGAVSNSIVKYAVPTAATITGFRVEAPGAGSAGSNNYALTVTKNGSSIGTTYTGSSTSTSVNALSPAVSFTAGDILAFTIGTVTGTVPNFYIQPVGGFL